MEKIPCGFPRTKFEESYDLRGTDETVGVQAIDLLKRVFTRWRSIICIIEIKTRLGLGKILA